jgi:hypothetical protein
MKPVQALTLSLLAIIGAALAGAPARAEDGAQSTTRLGEHPAVLVARKGVQPDPTANFYLHPARLEWSLQRPLSEGEHPAVLIARKGVPADPTANFYLHPARLEWSLQRPLPDDDLPAVAVARPAPIVAPETRVARSPEIF